MQPKNRNTFKKIRESRSNHSLPALLKEYEITKNEVSDLVNRFDKILGFGLVFLTAGIAAAYEYNSREVFLLLPPFTLALISQYYAVHRTLRVVSFYCKKLETDLNKILNEEIFKWERYYAPKYQYINPYHRLNFIAISILTVTIIILSYNQIFIQFERLFFIAYLVLTVLVILMWIYLIITDISNYKELFNNTFKGF